MIEYWADNSKNELNQRTFPVMLPFGSTEQHGNHLPVGTDHLLANAVVSNLVDRYKTQIDLSILPPLHYGKSTEHANFPGTITLSAHTLLSTLYDISLSLKRQAIPSLVILNTHGGNVGIVDCALYDIRMDYGIDAYAIHLGRIFESLGGKCAFPYSMHAGYVETAIMKHCYPEYERLYAITPDKGIDTAGFTKLTDIQSLISWGWATEDISAQEGYMGDPSQSTAEQGREILEAAVDVLFEQLKKICMRTKGRTL